MSEEEEIDWQRLESNPEVMTKYAAELGFDDSEFTFQDILSTEDWALEMLSPPCLGILLVFPYNDKHASYVKSQQNVDSLPLPKDTFFMKQFAKNACGSIAVFHVLGNLPLNRVGVKKTP